MFSDYGATLVRMGQNPYAYDLADAYRVYRASYTYSTPFLNGDFTGRSPYPALSFLLHVPFQLLGIPSSWIYFIFFLLTMGVVFLGTPAVFRPLILLPFIGVQEYVLYPLGGVSDNIWVFMICAMILAWRYRTQSAIWFGLACACKQQPWLFAPYLLVRVWHDTQGLPRQRWSAVLQFAVISALTFLLVNLPYIVWDWNAWLKGVLEPLQANMIVLGQGISSLTLFGVVMIPKFFYTLFVVVALAATVFLYWRHYDNWREAMWILPGIVLWLGNRSLNSYWVFNGIPLIFALVRSALITRPEAEPAQARAQFSWIPSAAAVGGTVLLIVVTVVGFSLKEPTVTVKIEGPMQTSGDLVYGLNVHVTNKSDQTLTPRFSVQTWANQPFIWHIDWGPMALPPGTDGYYIISADAPLRAFEFKRGGQVIVSDANSYNLRASVRIEGDLGSSYIDALPNGQFQYWDMQRNVPYAWGGMVEPAYFDAIKFTSSPPQPNMLRFTIPYTREGKWSYTKLDTWIPFPEQPIQVWINLPPQANLLPDLSIVYGLELVSTANQNRAWVLFGDKTASGEIEPGLRYWMIPAPRGVWSQQTIDLRQIFNELQLKISEPQRVSNWRLEFPVSMLNFRLLLAARNQGNRAVMADFGPVNSMSLLPDTEKLIRNRLEHPEEVYIWRGDNNFRFRNFDDAIANYTEAIKANPKAGAAYYGLGRAKAWKGDWDGATQALNAALDQGYRMPLSFKELGWIKYYTGNYDEAIRYFEEAIRGVTEHRDIYSATDLADANSGIGWAYLSQHQCVKATPYLGQARILIPSNQKAMQGLEQCLHKDFAALTPYLFDQE
ncbi:MAG: tetratricopeptide repeat protein [Anaerolineae bacterium]|nr:tetratricopeptide repeat protein [Anaerolineae bacterium]